MISDEKRELLLRLARGMVASEVGTAEWDASVLDFAETIAALSARAKEKAHAQGNAAVMSFGKSKGKSVDQLTMRDLNWYIEAVSRSVEDPGKARWVDSNMATLEALHGELNRRRQEGVGDAEIPF